MYGTDDKEHGHMMQQHSKSLWWIPVLQTTQKHHTSGWDCDFNQTCTKNKAQ